MRLWSQIDWGLGCSLLSQYDIVDETFCPKSSNFFAWSERILESCSLNIVFIPSRTPSDECVGVELRELSHNSSVCFRSTRRSENLFQFSKLFRQPLIRAWNAWLAHCLIVFSASDFESSLSLIQGVKLVTSAAAQCPKVSSPRSSRPRISGSDKMGRVFNLPRTSDSRRDRRIFDV